MVPDSGVFLAPFFARLKAQSCVLFHGYGLAKNSGTGPKKAPRWGQEFFPIPRSSGGSGFGGVKGALVGVVREDFDGTGRSFWSVSRSLTKTHRILSPAPVHVKSNENL